MNKFMMASHCHVQGRAEWEQAVATHVLHWHMWDTIVDIRQLRSRLWAERGFLSMKDFARCWGGLEGMDHSSNGTHKILSLIFQPSPSSSFWT